MVSNANCAIVDANVWIAYFDKDDLLYDQAKTLIDTTTQKTLVFTSYLIQEILTVFLYKNKSRLTKNLLLTLKKPDIEIVNVEHDFLKSIIQLAQDNKYQPKLSLTDWSLLFLAEEFGFQLLTFDKQLSNAYNQRLDSV